MDFLPSLKFKEWILPFSHSVFLSIFHTSVSLPHAPNTLPPNGYRISRSKKLLLGRGNIWNGRTHSSAFYWRLIRWIYVSSVWTESYWTLEKTIIHRQQKRGISLKTSVFLVYEAGIRKLTGRLSRGRHSFGETEPGPRTVLSACSSKCHASFRNVFLHLIKHCFGNKKALHWSFTRPFY